MNSQLLVEKLLKNQFDIDGKIIERRRRAVLEVVGASFVIDHSEIEMFQSFGHDEYDQYRLMIQGQIVRFETYLKLDKFSRRLLIQFPANWYDDRPQDYMPCPESFLIQYNNEQSYDVIVNFRSTELSRLSEDISIIKHLCQDELGLHGYINQIYIHCMNVHKYLDQGGSQDYDTESGYFDRKNI